MIIDEEEYLSHYGILRRSGRYPWGSTNNVPQSFLDFVQELRDEGYKDTEIAGAIAEYTDESFSTTQLRAVKSIAKNKIKRDNIRQAQKLRDKGWSPTAIGRRMGKNESSIRALLAEGAEDQANLLFATSNMIKEHVDEKKYVDVGAGNEHHLGVSSTKFKNAVALLREQGYVLNNIRIPQLGTADQYTTLKVLSPPGTTRRDAIDHRGDIALITDYSEDGGRTWQGGIKPPLSIDPSRVAVRYKDTGGAKADGVILVRPGVKDVSIGNSMYAQVRIKVGDGHYLKGMAMYNNNLPKGVDLMFNTAKESTGNDFDAMKPVSDDPNNPFGATIKLGGQQIEKDAGGKEQVVSVMNIVNEEGDWSNWSKSLSSQMLSKQDPALAKTQLDLTYEETKQDLDEITALTNPVVKKLLLKKLSESADSAAVHLKAAALPNQGTHAILPIESMPPTQIYAPNFENGDEVVLIRYPHGGTFEIPRLTVNNNQKEAKELLGRNPRDAVGIHHSVAERLSGADFDGDTVLVIPDKAGRITDTAALEELKDFDPLDLYKLPDDVPGIDNVRKQALMGSATNLVADMTIKGASASEIASAVKHTMVVIDAEKKHLDVKASALDNGIANLKQKYQGGAKAGASTLITKARRRVDVPRYKPRPADQGGPIDKETGALKFVPTGETRLNKKGEEVPRTKQSKGLVETEDAYTLLGDNPTRIERIYADHSNRLKKLANDARLEMINTRTNPKSESAARIYKAEADSLASKLVLAQRNSPLERQAQVIGNRNYRERLEANRYLDSDDKKKLKYQALTEARLRVGAKKPEINIEPNEWDAIQAGAISSTMLGNILNNADVEQVRQYATPTNRRIVTPAKLARIQAMMNSGYTRAEIAHQLGIALGTLDEALYG